jgi:LPXTG-site transpeptidase (sortase) family protein
MSVKKAEKSVPLHVVMISIGLICMLTAGALLLVMPRGGNGANRPAATTGRVIEPEATGTAVVAALMPETPLDGTVQPGNFANATEAGIAFQGQPHLIRIPAIELEAEIVTVGLQAVTISGQSFFQWQVPPQFSAGWHNTSSYLGQPGNTVLNGHHNIHGEVFGHLFDLQPGDEIILIDNQEQEFYYAVSDVEILPERGESLEVRMANAARINPTEDERVTLVTCWPHDDNSHRLIVVAHPQPVDPRGMVENSAPTGE